MKKVLSVLLLGAILATVGCVSTHTNQSATAAVPPAIPVQVDRYAVETELGNERVSATVSGNIGACPEPMLTLATFQMARLNHHRSQFRFRFQRFRLSENSSPRMTTQRHSRRLLSMWHAKRTTAIHCWIAAMSFQLKTMWCSSRLPAKSPAHLLRSRATSFCLL